MESVIGLDPGNEKSAFVHWTGKKILNKGIHPNEELIKILEYSWIADTTAENIILAIEDMQSIHQKSGKTIIDTLKWAGRFYQAWQGKREWITRDQVKLALGVKDDMGIRAVLIQRFGAPGTKKNPGLTYGLAEHTWAAFAVAVTHLDHLEFQARVLT